MASNPRIEDLRRRIEKEPGSRLFAQLAEELRKDGELDEAIRVCRDGLAKHPAYPSARMTLGRALFDKLDLEGARREFEAVLKGAPDNILASRFLGECLEGLGDVSGARSQYQATLALAPGDRQVVARLETLGKPATAASRTAAPPASPTGPPAASGTVPAGASGRAAEPPPIPLAVVDEPLELEQPHERGQMLYPTATASSGSHTPDTAGAEPPPIPLSAAEEFFELESPFNEPGTGWAKRADDDHGAGRGAAGDSAEAHAPGSASAVPEEAGLDFEFDLESGSTAPVPMTRLEPPGEAVWVQPEAAPSVVPELVSSPDSIAREGQAEPLEAEGGPAPPSAGAEPLPDPGTGERGEIASTTLAELYFAQGFREKATDVFRQVLKREPGNERARARLAEIDSVQVGSDATSTEAPAVAVVPPASPALDGGSRREAVQRTIERLEGLLEMLRRLRH